MTHSDPSLHHEKVAVTGGAGYIGSSLVKELLDLGAEVVSIDNLIGGDYTHLRKAVTEENAKLLIGDIRDGEKLVEALDDASSVVHLAALPGLKQCRENPEKAVSINVHGTFKVLEAARKLDIKKVVFSSSASVYGKPEYIPVRESHPLNPLNLYGVTKLAGEKLMEAYHGNYGLETISLRFGNVFGVGLYTKYGTVIPKFVKQGLAGEPLTVYGDGHSSRDFVHVRDIVQALILSLKAEKIGGESFNVGGETIKIGVLASKVKKMVKERAGADTRITYHPPRPGETKEFSYTLEKIEGMLGYRKKWSINRGIEQLIDYTLRQTGTSLPP